MNTFPTLRCGSPSGARVNGVVPLRTHLMRLEREGGHLYIAHLDPCLVYRGDQMRLNLQSRRSSRVVDVVHRHLKRPQRTSRPGLADFTKQPMFHRVPFRGTRRIMTDRNRQTQTIGNLLLQLLFPDPRAGAVAPTAIRFDQQARGVWKALTQFGRAPMGNAVNRKCRCIGRLPNIHRPTVSTQIVDSVRHRPSECVVGKIMGIDNLSLLTPDLPTVLEVADQLLLFGIHTDHWLPAVEMNRALGSNVLELGIPLRMLLAGLLLAIGPQAVALRAQQATDHRLTDGMTTSGQRLSNVGQATIEPFGAGHWITRRMRRDHLQQHTDQLRVFFSAASRPPPGCRWRSGGSSTKPALTSRRPRRMVLRSRPVIRANSTSLGRSGSCESIPTNQRRWGSVSRLRKRFIR